MDRMQKGSHGSTGRNAHRYRITVRARLTQAFVESLEQVFIESTSNELILDCEAVDQAERRAILSWLFERGVEIVSVAPHTGGPDSEDPR
jgi:hypothetical protein